jgi:hypothetical protein
MRVRSGREDDAADPRNSEFGDGDMHSQLLGEEVPYDVTTLLPAGRD